MEELRRAAEAFLSSGRLAVAGVARDGGSPANLIYRRLRADGYDVAAVNPHATEVEGDACHPSVTRVPGGVAGVVIATAPAVSAAVVRECAEAGVSRVWLHRSFGAGSVSGEAVSLCRELGMDVIPGGCPMMFLEPVDVGHRCMRWVLDRLGKLPG